MATQMLGATTVGIYATNAWEQVQFVVNHAGCKLLFAEDEEQVDKWLRFRSDTPQLEKVIYWEDKGLAKMDESELMRFDDLINSGHHHFPRIVTPSIRLRVVFKMTILLS